MVSESNVGRVSGFPSGPSPSLPSAARADTLNLFVDRVEEVSFDERPGVKIAEVHVAKLGAEGVFEVLPGTGGHLAHLAQQAGGVGSQTRQLVWSEDQQGEHRDRDDLPHVDVEHRSRVSQNRLQPTAPPNVTCECDLLLAAFYRQCDRVAGQVAADQDHELLVGLDRLSINGHDDVAGLNSSEVGCSTGRDGVSRCRRLAESGRQDRGTPGRGERRPLGTQPLHRRSAVR